MKSTKPPNSSSLSLKLHLLFFQNEKPRRKNHKRTKHFADNEGRILHLLKAFGEAIGMGSIELGEVILQRISKKVSPVGATMERLGHYLSQCDNHQNDYLERVWHFTSKVKVK